MRPFQTQALERARRAGLSLGEKIVAGPAGGEADTQHVGAGRHRMGYRLTGYRIYPNVLGGWESEMLDGAV